MFEFDVEVERDVRAVYFVAAFVGAGEVFLYFDCESSILFPVLELVEFGVTFLEGLATRMGTSSFSTSFWRCEVFSDMSLMREKLSSFLR